MKPINGAPRRPHILAINNDESVLSLFRSLLENEGCEVSTQAYADRNLDGIVALEPDLIILDYMWRDDDAGWSFLQMLRMSPLTAHIPIVLCTTAIREMADLSGHLAEMKVQVVIKPFNIGTLLTAIREQLVDTATPLHHQPEPPSPD